MKNKITKRIVSTFLSALLISSALVVNTSLVSAVEEDTKESKYLVLTESDFALNKAEELSSQSESIFSDDNTTVAKVFLSKSDVNALKNTDGVIAVEKDVTFSGSATDDNEDVDVIDYLFKDVDTDDLNLWYLDAVGSPNVDNGDKVKIELLDSGVNLNSDINVKERINLIEDDYVNPLYEDFSGHGTSLASVIGAKDNDEGVTGINPYAKLYSVRVLDDNIQAPLSRIIKGIQWGIDNNMDIINMSFGTNTNSAILREVIQKADEAGILLVSATGNDPDSGVQYPAAYPEVLAVGSMNENSEISDFTSVGDEMDVVAPGEKIETAGIFGTINGTSGTSISTAEVSAVASKILERDKSKSPDFVKGLILASAKKIQDGDVTTGAVDCNYALEIYDEYEKTYETSNPTQEYTNPIDVETYDTEGIVQGLWVGKEHEKLADYAYSDLVGAKKLGLITASAKAADKEISGGNTNLNETMALHGKGNYVLNFRTAWKFVCELKKSDSTIKTATTAMINSYNDILDELNQKDLERLEQLVDNFSNLNKLDMSKTFDVTDNMDKDATICKAIGLSIHMIGDTFAHRTMVPDTYGDSDHFNKVNDNGKNFFIAAANPESLDFKNNIELRRNLVKDVQNNKVREQFWNKKSLYRAVSYGVVECQDIRLFSFSHQNGTDTGKLKVNNSYADCPMFYEERYIEAEAACGYLYTEVSVNGYSKMDKKGDVYTKMFVPFTSDYKMNNLKNYITTIGADTSFKTNSQWNSCSFSDLTNSQIDALQ